MNYWNGFYLRLAASPLSRLRHPIMTFAPRLANSLATSFPIPKKKRKMSSFCNEFIQNNLRIFLIVRSERKEDVCKVSLKFADSKQEARFVIYIHSIRVNILFQFQFLNRLGNSKNRFVEDGIITAAWVLSKILRVQLVLSHMPQTLRSEAWVTQPTLSSPSLVPLASSGIRLGERRAELKQGHK